LASEDIDRLSCSASLSSVAFITGSSRIRGLTDRELAALTNDRVAELEERIEALEEENTELRAEASENEYYVERGELYGIGWCTD
jgi:hypothetical protein